MKNNWMKYIKLTMFALFLAAMLVACGSSGGGNNSESDGNNTPEVVPTATDECPLDPNKTEGGECGCGVPDTDSDGDGTADCNDSCDEDPGKTEFGTCGCGTPDTDTDGDGTPDCIDECEAGTDTDGDGVDNCDEICDEDPDKTDLGDCGCGVPDTDSDGDGTADCNEECDDDPNKTAPGICDCGTPDTDEDEDGVIDCLEPHFVAVGRDGTILSSIDGMNWDVHSTDAKTEVINDVAAGSWVGVGKHSSEQDAVGEIAVVDDAFNMITETISPSYELFGVTNDGNVIWISVGADWTDANPIFSKSSDDGVSWTTDYVISDGETEPSTQVLYEIATDDNSNWVAVGEGNGSVVAITNNNGDNWKTRKIGTIAALYGIAYQDNETVQHWITVGSNGGIAISDDIGITWDDSKSLTGTSDSLVDIANNNDGTWVAVGMKGLVAVSADNGATWSSYNIDTGGEDLRGVVFGDGLWIAVGTDGAMYYSTTAADGSWTAVAGLPVENLNSVAYKE